MSRLPTLSAKKLIKILQKKGFIEIRQVGSHKFFKHADGRTTVVPFHAQRDIGRGLLREILNETDIDASEL